MILKNVKIKKMNQIKELMIQKNIKKTKKEKNFGKNQTLKNEKKMSVLWH